LVYDVLIDEALFLTDKIKHKMNRNKNNHDSIIAFMAIVVLLFLLAIPALEEPTNNQQKKPHKKNTPAHVHTISYNSSTSY
jgi:hypothetical protein